MLYFVSENCCFGYTIKVKVVVSFETQHKRKWVDWFKYFFNLYGGFPFIQCCFYLLFRTLLSDTLFILIRSYPYQKRNPSQTWSVLLQRKNEQVGIACLKAKLCTDLLPSNPTEMRKLKSCRLAPRDVIRWWYSSW